MNKPIIEIKLKLDDKFDVAFPDKLIPSNSYLDKSKTGLGMTHSELIANRNSIIVIPLTTVIELKARAHSDLNLIKVIGKAPKKPDTKIIDFLNSGRGDKKILTTPESFKRVMDVVRENNLLDWFYDEFFCLLDEAHCYAVEMFREHILMPFHYFWKFKNKSLGTATYFPYSDPAFDMLQNYKITYDESFGTIEVIQHKDPKSVLIELLRNRDQFPGNIHVFFNTVKQIEKVIREVGLTDVYVFCREDERNLRGLRESAVHFKSRPDTIGYKKVNFYTAKYNEGWDLFDDENSTIILATDVGIPHSLAGIEHTGFQAIGRLRKYIPHTIYHVTNHFDKEDDEVKSFDTIHTNWYYQAARHVNYHNQFQAMAADEAMEDKGLSWKLASLFSIFNTPQSKINPMKVDQHICAEYIQEGYANLQTIIASWRAMNYRVKVKIADLPLIVVVDTPKDDVNRQVVEALEEYQIFPERYLQITAERTLSKLGRRYPKLIAAYTILGSAKLKELGYNDDLIKQAMIAVNNSNLDSEVKNQARDRFVPNTEYTRDMIGRELGFIYKDLNYLNKKGTIKVGLASQLEQLEVFSIRKTQRTIHAEMCEKKRGCKCKRSEVWILNHLL